jgi:hypothetical protein
VLGDGNQPELHYRRSAAADRARLRSVPIVFVNIADPVGSGFVASLARPGGNITGFLTFEFSIGGKWLELRCCAGRRRASGRRDRLRSMPQNPSARTAEEGKSWISGWYPECVDQRPATFDCW